MPMLKTPLCPLLGIEYAPMWAGESVGRVHEIKPAGQIVADIVAEAEAALRDL